MCTYAFSHLNSPARVLTSVDNTNTLKHCSKLTPPLRMIPGHPDCLHSTRFRLELACAFGIIALAEGAKVTGNASLSFGVVGFERSRRNSAGVQSRRWQWTVIGGPIQ